MAAVGSYEEVCGAGWDGVAVEVDATVPFDCSVYELLALLVLMVFKGGLYRWDRLVLDLVLAQQWCK